MTSRPHDELVDLLGAYALDAVDGLERIELEDHLRDCPRCRAEVEQHRETAIRLASAGAPAPEGLWDRIAADLDTAAADLAWPRLYPLTSRRSAVRVVAAAAAVIALGFGAMGWQLHRESARVASLSDQIHGTSLQKLMAATSLDPSSTRLTLASPDRKVLVSVVLGADGAGYLANNGSLPTLSKRQTYQLWGITAGAKISLGVIGPAPTIVAFPAAEHDFVAMALTAEDAGGSIQPTGTPVASAFVPPQ